MVKRTDIQILKGMIEDHRSSLMERIDLDNGNPGLVLTSANYSKADLAGDLARQEIRNLMHDQAIQQLDQIEKALQRIEDGTYGKCAHCGEKIPLPRLRIKPYATLCVNCKSRHESI